MTKECQTTLTFHPGITTLVQRRLHPTSFPELTVETVSRSPICRRNTADHPWDTPDPRATAESTGTIVTEWNSVERENGTSCGRTEPFIPDDRFPSFHRDMTRCLHRLPSIHLSRSYRNQCCSRLDNFQHTLAGTWTSSLRLWRSNLQRPLYKNSQRLDATDICKL